MIGDLTTVDRAKSHIFSAAVPAGIVSNDEIIGRLVTSVSQFVLNFMNRQTLITSDFVDVIDSGGAVDFLMLRQWPVVDVSKVEFSGITITSAATNFPATNGYLLETPSPGGGQQRLTLPGYRLPRGRSAVRVSYSAGFRVSAEAHTVPAASTYRIEPRFMWLADGGVTLANGTALTRVTGSPAALQYSVNEDGLYTLNAAQAGVGVLISYDYVPALIESAVLEMVGERFKARDRIGLKSKNLPNGETITFDTRDMGDYARRALQPFIRLF